MDDNQHHGQQGGRPPQPPPPPPPSGTFPPGHQPYYAPPPPEEMGTGKVVGLSALACCIPLIGPVIALIIGIIERAKNGATVVIVIGGIMLVLSLPILGVYIAIGLPWLMYAAPESVQDDFFERTLGEDFYKIQDKANEAEVKQNLHLIQLNIERYLIDRDGKYPDSLEQVIQAGYFDEFPENPFSYSPMREVNLSDNPEDKAGNFTYLPESTDGTITGYTLLGYGSINTTDSFYPGGSGSAAVVVSLSGGVVSDKENQAENQD